MTTRSTKSLLIGAMASLALALGVTEADAQQQPVEPGGLFRTGDASTYAVPDGQKVVTLTNGVKITGGTLRMRSSESKIEGKWGTSAGNRMPGTVIWYCKSTIPGGTFFTDLGTGGGGDVTVGPGTIDIAGDYKPNGDNEGGTRTYPEGSNVNFSGGDDPTKPQVIPGENGGNGGGFDIVTISGDGTKTTPVCGEGDVVIKQLKRGDKDKNGQPSESRGTILNKGNLTLAYVANRPHEAYIIENAVDATAGCGITLKEDAKLKVYDFTNTSGFWSLEARSTVEMNNNFVYKAGDMKFDCASNFHYNGTTNNQIIAATTSANSATGFYKYGNLWLSGGEKVTQEVDHANSPIDGMFRVCNDLKTESRVDLKDDLAMLLNETQGNHVFFQVPGTGTTEDKDVEIEGKLQYNNVGAGTELTFNNKDTKITFETATDLNFALEVRPKTIPTKLNDYVAEKDVKRKINVTYGAVEGKTTYTGKISHLQVSWKAADEEGTEFATNGPNNDTNPIRFAEGWKENKPRKKIIRVGAEYNNDIANRIVKYGKSESANGIELGGQAPDDVPADQISFNQKLFNGSDIVLSTQVQKVVSVLNGRWSNPAIWDTGLEPSPNDDVEIATTVWVGDHNQIFGVAAGYPEDERAIKNANSGTDKQYAANSITIKKETANAGLYINMVDPNMADFANSDKEVAFRTRMVGSADKVGIFNLNENAENAVPNTSSTGMNGIFIGAVTGDYMPVVGAANWINNGTFTNNGVAEVGTCLP